MKTIYQVQGPQGVSKQITEKIYKHKMAGAYLASLDIAWTGLHGDAPHNQDP